MWLPQIYPKTTSGLECSIIEHEKNQHFICTLARDQAYWWEVVMNKLRKFISRNAGMHLTQEPSPFFQGGISILKISVHTA